MRRLHPQLRRQFPQPGGQGYLERAHGIAIRRPRRSLLQLGGQGRALRRVANGERLGDLRLNRAMHSFGQSAVISAF